MSEFQASNFKKENGGTPDLLGKTELTSPYFFVPPSGNTADRPESCAPGTLRFNTDIGTLEVYRGDTLGWEQIQRNEIHDGVYPEARGFHVGARPGPGELNNIEFIRFASLGNPVDFGDKIHGLNGGNYNQGAFASITRGFVYGGRFPGTPSAFSNAIEFITMSTLGNGTDFGDLTEGTQHPSGVSDKTRGVRMGGLKSAGPQPYQASGTNVIDFVTMASQGNAIDFGDTYNGDTYGINGACSDRTRGVRFGGASPAPFNTNIIDFITIQSAGNSVDFGDMTSGTNYNCAAANSVRGLSAVDAGNNDAAIDAVTIATTGNAVDFGDMANTVAARQGCSSPLKMAIMGGGAPAYSSNCEFVNISTFGNGVDFGGASAAWGYSHDFSNSHGGLA